MHKIYPACLIAALVGATFPVMAGRAVASPPANPAEIRMPGVDGHVVEITKDNAPALTVLCFLGAECPLARLYGRRLASYAQEYKSQGVRFVGINSNRQDSMEEVRAYAAQHGIQFPLAKDYGNVLADQYRVKRTPEVVVLDRDFTVRYRGRIDDQYSPGIVRPQTTRQYLRTALEEALAGQAVSQPYTEPCGCLIGRVKKAPAQSEITYCNQVARLLQKHCVECHRPGEIGPFALTDYEEVVGWADMVLEVVEEGRMPPWHASREYGQFANARFLSDGEKQTLKKWVASGAAYGNPDDLPEPVKYTDGWNLPREPDVVLSMSDRAFTVPADGIVEYQYFVVDPGFEQDRWITAAQVIPGNRAVVHHSIVFVRPPDGSRFRGVGWLTAYVPGQRSTTLLPGRARRVPAGSKLVFQQHYTPIGNTQSDLTKVGIVFGQEQDVTHEVYTLVGIDQEFEIPPHAAHFAVKSNVSRIPAQGELLAIMPHMHLRGKSFRLFRRKDGRRDILLDIPRYDFNWQHSYQLKQPLPLSSIDALEFTVTFDNSAANPVNPDPTQHVTWGDQTWEEMAVAFFEVSEPRDQQVPAPASTTRDREESDSHTKQVDDFVNRFIKRFDRNNDGEVDRSETPLSLRTFGFRQFDKDRDGKLTRSEIQDAARERMR